MPELPEIRRSCNVVNHVCCGRVFTGAVRKSDVSKNAEVAFSAQQYTIRAESRGKEMVLELNDKLSAAGAKSRAVVRLLFHFGMSGRFQFSGKSEIHKHAHLKFTTSETPPNTLSFVDVRRFGTWRVLGDGELWGPDRGPDPVSEYTAFRENVLASLEKPAFNKPICEVMLNQVYFNGIGNYLRCEILHRVAVPPFSCARQVLQDLQQELDVKKGKESSPDVLQCCRDITQEVLNLKGGAVYDPDSTEGSSEENYRTFLDWLQCYTRSDAMNVRDHNGRTMWYKGELGPLVPKARKSVGKARLTTPPLRDVKLQSRAKSTVSAATVPATTTLKGRRNVGGAASSPTKTTVRRRSDGATAKSSVRAATSGAAIRNVKNQKMADQMVSSRRPAKRACPRVLARKKPTAGPETLVAAVTTVEHTQCPGRAVRLASSSGRVSSRPTRRSSRTKT